MYGSTAVGIHYKKEDWLTSMCVQKLQVYISGILAVENMTKVGLLGI